MLEYNTIRSRYHQSALAGGIFAPKRKEETMKKEDFVALGISEELASKAEQESKKELEGYVPKADLEALNATKAQLEKDIKTRDKQLEELKRASGSSEELQKQITDLQTENKAAKEKYEADMKELKLTTAIKLAIGDSAHDADLVSGLVDKSKLLLGEDGKVTGLDEQVKALKEGKAFLFKEYQDPGTFGQKNKPGYKPKAGETTETGWAKTVAESLNKETSKNPYADAWETK